MLSIRKFSPVVRATGIIGVVAGLATAVTFAALSSQATLTANTISSATAGLLVQNVDVPQGPATTVNGFAFNGVVPGGAGSTIGHFNLVNSGTANLSLNTTTSVLPTWIVTPSGAVDNSQVGLTINCTSTNSGTFTLADNLADIAANNPALAGGPLKAGDTAVCSAQVSMLSTAFSGSSASLGNFDLVFTGTGS